MISIDVRNVNEALGQAIPLLVQDGIREESRNGTVLVAPTPVCTTYNKPLERVVFGNIRDANPFFHLMEALWMLAGGNDLEWPRTFNKRFKEYSDDGETIHGAYGYRWREYFMFDQLEQIVLHMQESPNTRRAVLTMWSPEGDLIPHRLRPYAFGTAGQGGLSSKDVPCNTHAYFDLRDNKLNMTVCNRSNDVIWGAYGANVVHFSLLQEYIANRLKVQVGVYRQFSNNFHAYTDIYDEEKLVALAKEAQMQDYYKSDGQLQHVNLMNVTPEGWHNDLYNFITRKEQNYVDPFFYTVAEPMYQAWAARKAGDIKQTYKYLDTMPRCDWKVACQGWVVRREDRKNAA